MKHRKSEAKALTSIADSLAKQSATGRDSSRSAKKDDVVRPGLFLGLVKAFNVSAGRTARATAARRAFPIHAYVGPNGGGKSLAMVADSMISLRAGRTVLSTVALLEPSTGQKHPNYVRFEDWDQLLEARDCDVLMDEMVGIASSRESMRLDQRVQNVLVQLRRRNVVLRWSAPNWARADKIVREVTQAVTECRGSFPQKMKATEGDDTGVQLWSPKRMFTFRTYDTIDFEEWTAGKREKARPIASQWFYGPGSDVFDSYDTLDAVSMVSGITPEGLCDVCSKKVRMEYCKGHHGDPGAQHPVFDELELADPRRAAALSLEDTVTF